MAALRFMAAGFAMFAAAAAAQSSDDWTACVDGMGLARAIDACSRVIDAAKETGPRLAKAYALRAMGKALKAIGENSSDQPAIDDYTASLATAPSREALTGRGELYYIDKRYGEAAADYARAAALDPKAGPDTRLGEAYEHLGKAKEALTAYDGLVAHHRKDPQVYMARGDFHLRNKNGAAAAADFATALKLEPKGYYNHEYAELEYRLGLAERLKGNEKAAAAAIAKAKSIYPDAGSPLDDY